MSAEESTLASFTRPDPGAPDKPLGLIRTLERAQEFLEAGETADNKAAIQGALEKAREDPRLHDRGSAPRQRL